MSNKTTSDLTLLAPRRVTLTPAQQREAAALLAELLFDAAAKRRELHSDGALGSDSRGVIGSVVQLPRKRGNAREAA